MRRLVAVAFVLAVPAARADSGAGPAQPSWTVHPEVPPAPGGRSGHAMAADQATGRVFLFGGTGKSGEYRDDLWAWDGERWEACAADERPPARADAAMAYDPIRRSLLLFGGTSYEPGPYGLPTDFADTWEWSLVQRRWAELRAETGPAPRSGHAMVTDTARGRVVLVGGVTTDNYNSVPAGVEVWEWDGQDARWVARPVPRDSAVPDGRSHLALAFDGQTRELILYEGASPGGESQPPGAGDYWTWDPDTGIWNRVGALGPAISAENAWMTCDRSRGRTVLIGSPSGGDGALGNRTLTWELHVPTRTWTQREVASPPASRAYAGLAFDNLRGVVVLFGGFEAGVLRGDTWEYRGSGLPYASECAGDAAPACASDPCMGNGTCGEPPRPEADAAAPDRDGGVDGAQATIAVRLGRSGCSCSLGHVPMRAPGWPLLMVGAGIALRRLRQTE